MTKVSEDRSSEECLRFQGSKSEDQRSERNVESSQASPKFKLVWVNYKRTSCRQRYMELEKLSAIGRQSSHEKCHSANGNAKHYEYNTKAPYLKQHAPGEWNIQCYLSQRICWLHLHIKELKKIEEVSECAYTENTTSTLLISLHLVYTLLI